MLAPESEDGLQPAPPVKDYSQALMIMVILLLLAWLVAFVGGIFTLGYIPFNLFALQLIPLFGLALLSTWIALLFFIRPGTVRNLGIWLASRFARAPSSPQEVGIGCFWVSAWVCFYGIQSMLIFSGHELTGTPEFIITMGFVVGSMVASKSASFLVRRRNRARQA